MEVTLNKECVTMSLWMRIVLILYFGFSFFWRGRCSELRLTITNITEGDYALAKQDVDRLHHEAHEECYIANSVETSIDIQGTWEVRGARSQEPESRRTGAG